jgi:hypothetical protein
MSNVVFDPHAREQKESTFERVIENVNPFENDSIWTQKLALNWSVLAVYDCSKLENMFGVFPETAKIADYFKQQNIDVYVENLPWIDRYGKNGMKMNKLKPADHVIRVYANSKEVLENSPFEWVQFQLKDEKYS